MIGKLLSILTIPILLGLVLFTSVLEHHTIRQIVPNPVAAVFGVAVIAACKITATFLYRRYKNKKSFSESSKGIAMAAIAMLFLFATTMATVSINSLLYKSQATEAYNATMAAIESNMDIELKLELEPIDSNITLYQNRVEEQRKIVVNGIFKGPYYKEYSKELEKYEQRRSDIIAKYKEKRTNRIDGLDIRLTDQDDKNPVVASFVYAFEDIAKGNAYGITIFIIGLITSLTFELLIIYFSNTMGVMYSLFDDEVDTTGG